MMASGHGKGAEEEEGVGAWQSGSVVVAGRGALGVVMGLGSPALSSSVLPTLPPLPHVQLAEQLPDQLGIHCVAVCPVITLGLRADTQEDEACPLWALGS